MGTVVESHNEAVTSRVSTSLKAVPVRTSGQPEHTASVEGEAVLRKIAARIVNRVSRRF